MTEKTIIEPLGARVLIKRLPITERKTDAGLIIPENEVQTTYKSEVVSKGGDVGNDIGVGDTVIVTHMVGDMVSVNQEKFYLVNDKDILAVLRVEDDDDQEDAFNVIPFSAVDFGDDNDGK